MQKKIIDIEKRKNHYCDDVGRANEYQIIDQAFLVAKEKAQTDDTELCQLIEKFFDLFPVYIGAEKITNDISYAYAAIEHIQYVQQDQDKKRLLHLFIQLGYGDTVSLQIAALSQDADKIEFYPMVKDRDDAILKSIKSPEIRDSLILKEIEKGI